MLFVVGSAGDVPQKVTSPSKTALFAGDKPKNVTSPALMIGLSYALARGIGQEGDLHPQSYQIQAMVWRQKTELHFMHRGGKYVKPTEVFGPGVFYQQ